MNLDNNTISSYCDQLPLSTNPITQPAGSSTPNFKEILEEFKEGDLQSNERFIKLISDSDICFATMYVSPALDQLHGENPNLCSKAVNNIIKCLDENNPTQVKLIGKINEIAVKFVIKLDSDTSNGSESYLAVLNACLAKKTSEGGKRNAIDDYPLTFLYDASNFTGDPSTRISVHEQPKNAEELRTLAEVASELKSIEFKPDIKTLTDVESQDNEELISVENDLIKLFKKNPKLYSVKIATENFTGKVILTLAESPAPLTDLEIICDNLNDRDLINLVHKQTNLRHLKITSHSKDITNEFIFALIESCKYLTFLTLLGFPGLTPESISMLNSTFPVVILSENLKKSIVESRLNLFQNILTTLYDGNSELNPPPTAEQIDLMLTSKSRCTVSKVKEQTLKIFRVKAKCGVGSAYKHYFGPILNTGSFAKVFIVQNSENPKDILAIKKARKKRNGILTYEPLQILMNEFRVIKILNPKGDVPGLPSLSGDMTMGKNFFALPLYDGDLKGINQILKGLPQKKKLLAIQQLLTGLQHMHEMEFIHGDIKPENCLYKTQTVKNADGVDEIGFQFILADLAGAKDIDQFDGHIIHSKRFVPPVLNPHAGFPEVQKRDVYALALTMIETLIESTPEAFRKLHSANNLEGIENELANSIGKESTLFRVLNTCLNARKLKTNIQYLPTLKVLSDALKEAINDA